MEVAVAGVLRGKAGVPILTTYFRSSSYSAYDLCEFDYYLRYVLGLPSPANLKADKGNISHKALELLARWKAAVQQGKDVFEEDESKTSLPVAGFGPEDAVRIAWDYYKRIRPKQRWSAEDFDDCRRWVYAVLEFNGGQFSPVKRKVVEPEHYFDFEVPLPWALYDFPLPDGGRLKGRLAVKGTVDLLTEASADTLEYIDYKTGERKDWSTGKEKPYHKLRDDPQLRLYHYAIVHDFPKYKHVIMTIFFTRSGGPFSFAFGPEDLRKTEDMLRERFEAVRNNNRPALLRDRGGYLANIPWCRSVCHFGKTRQEGTDRSVCEHMRQELLTLGTDRVFAKYGDVEKLKNYGSGGGRNKGGA